MITLTSPTIQLSFNITKTDYRNGFRSYWFGYCKGAHINYWTPSENGDYTNITLTVTVNQAMEIADMLYDCHNSGYDIIFEDIKRIHMDCLNIVKEVAA